VMIDDAGQTMKTAFSADNSEIKLFADGGHVSLMQTEITRGFEESFEIDDIPGGLTISGTANCKSGHLDITATDTVASATLNVPYENFEIAANLALSDDSVKGEYGIELLSEQPACRLAIDPANRSIVFWAGGDERRVELPDSFVGDEFRQFRVVCKNERALAYLDGIFIGDMPSVLAISSASIFGQSGISIEMIRLTEI
jgi:hypothetical protein